MPKLTARERPVLAFISLIALALLLAISLVPTVGGAPVHAEGESSSELPFSEAPSTEESPPQPVQCAVPDSGGPLPQGSQTISGTVTTDEPEVAGPLGGIEVRFSTTPAGFRAGSVFTDPEGTYAMSGLGDGTYRVSFFDGSGIYHSGFHSASGLVLTPGEADAVVLSGSGAVVNAVLPYEATRNVRGVVTDSVDLPVAGVVLTAESVYFPVAACDDTAADGSYSIQSVRTMVFRLRVTDTSGLNLDGYYSDGALGNFTTSFAAATLLTAGPADMEGVDIQFPALYTLSGVVRDEALDPVLGISVTACGTAGEACANAVSNEEGEFTIVGLVAGDYILRMDGYSAGYLSGYYDGPGEFTSFEAEADPVTVADDVTGLDLLAVPPPTAPTPECAGDECQPIPLDDGTGATPVTLTFENVIGEGETTLTIPPNQEPTPAGFKFGEPPTYYEITTTANLASGSLYQICISFDPDDFEDPGGVRLFHLVSEPSPGAWENITLPGYPVAGVVCGEADSLSPFALVEPEYSFGGFFGAKAPPQLNEAKAGDVVAIQFSLGADIGLSIFLAGSPTVERVDCVTGAAIGGSAAAASGTPALKFNARTQRYTFQWKTDKAWKNTCQRLVLTFRDESSAEVIFRFKK